MIVIDTSAAMAVLADEGPAEACRQAMAVGGDLLMSAGTLAELLIVAGHRNLGEKAGELLFATGMDVRPVSLADARRVGHAHTRWGKGVHPAGLNFGDCFAYALAKQEDCPLLFVGNDFAQTDIRSALA